MPYLPKTFRRAAVASLWRTTVACQPISLMSNWIPRACAHPTAMPWSSASSELREIVVCVFAECLTHQLPTMTTPPDVDLRFFRAHSKICVHIHIQYIVSTCLPNIFVNHAGCLDTITAHTFELLKRPGIRHGKFWAQLFARKSHVRSVLCKVVAASCERTEVCRIFVPKYGRTNW